MERIKLEGAIDALSKVITVPEEKREEIIARYSSMEELAVIKELSQIVYTLFKDNDEVYTYCLEVIRNLNPGLCPSIEEMKQMLHKMFSNDVEGNMSLEDNHKLVNTELVRFTTLLNQYGVDYYIVGALPCFLKTGQPLFRYHDDIDIMINEDDIPKVKEVVELCGYQFHDDRFPSVERFHEMEKNKPPHTVLAQNPNNEFHIGFFTFKREQDQSITMREYSHRLEDGQVAVDVLERRSDPMATLLRYDETPTEYMGTTFKTSTVESVYSLKQYTKRPKDITDVEHLKPFINEQKLAALKQKPLDNVEIKNVKRDSNQPIPQNN